MRTAVSAFLTVAALLWCGCGRERPAAEPAPETRKPVVAVAPVPTKPFEEGYNAGFDLGRQQAAPRARLPDPADVQRLAREQASGHPDRTERWERGFVEGYTDGFRNVVTGQK